MKFSSEYAGDIRIEAAAIDSSQGGFRACVYLREVTTDTLLWFEEDLSGGRVFATTGQALAMALNVGRFRARRLIDDRDSVEAG